MVRDESAVGIFAERQREAIEVSLGAIPDVPVAERVQRRLELLAKSFADRGVDAIGADDQIAVSKCAQVRHALAKAQVHTQVTAVRLEYLQECQTRDPGKAQAVDAHLLIAMYDGLVVPGLEPLLDISIGGGVGLFEKAERPG
jgi:hypothetical protein